MKRQFLIAAVLAALASRATFAASEGGDTWSAVEANPASSVNGTPLNNSVADRIVRVGPKSRWINVGYGESVRFISQDGTGAERSFSWRFDVSPEVSSVELSQLAPAYFPEHDVRVFVSPNPLYAGG